MPGAFCLVLHSHLPWLPGHGVWPLGEEWLFQAWVESYVPLVAELDSLAAEGHRDVLTLGVTPVLAAQLEAQKIMFTDPTRTITEYRNLTSLDEATARTSVEHYAKSVGNKGFRFTTQDFNLNKQMISKINTATAGVDLATVVDISYLDKLQTMGFNAELQFP